MPDKSLVVVLYGDLQPGIFHLFNHCLVEVLAAPGLLLKNDLNLFGVLAQIQKISGKIVAGAGDLIVFLAVLGQLRCIPETLRVQKYKKENLGH